ncbi:MAG: PAS domain S-box protein [Alphaproteobacteria bacterium]
MEPNASRSLAVTDENRYRLLVEAIRDYAVYMLDPQGLVTSWNSGAQRFKGYTAAEIIGQHFSQFYTPEDRAAGLPQRALETSLREGKFESEGWRLRKDGTRFWTHVVIDPIRAPDGAHLGFAKITRDLSDRKMQDEALRRSEEQFRILVQGVTDYAIYFLSPEGLVTNWNAGAERIKGYAPQEIVGRHFSTFYTEEERAAGEPVRALRVALAEGRIEREGWRVRKDGTRFWAHVVIDPIYRDGKHIGFAKITRDVSERLKAQQELEQAREALFQSQKMDAIGQLTGGVAHDFNNLLMAVLGSLELARKRIPDDPRVTPLLENATQAAKRGAALTQRMLAFARRQQLDLKPIVIAELVEGMTDLLQRSLGPQILVKTGFAPALPEVLADANQLEMALLNLALNARDAMPQGGELRVAAEAEAVAAGHTTGLPPGLYVRLSVADSGEGMDADTLAHAVEPFFTTKGVGKGTGLGLPMVHGLAEQSGGRLVLKSRKGEGTVAELWLPTATAPAVAAASAETGAAESAARPLVVMAVDDDALVLMNTVEMLEELGHTVLQAASAPEALGIMREAAMRDVQGIDLLVTDQAMPQMTGVQLAETVRREWPGLPIILATGYGELSPGADRKILKLAKPFSEQDLAHTIQQALHSARRA